MDSKKLLYAHVLIDGSSSMESIRAETVSGVNEYVRGLAEDSSTDAAVSITSFHSGITQITSGVHLQEHFDGKPASEVLLTHTMYRPNGMTPLYDAIGSIVTKMKKQWHRPNESIALVIVTDGQENCSREHTAGSISKLLEEVQAEGWLVIYLGANQDAILEGSKMGIRRDTTMNYDTANIGYGLSSAALRSTKSYVSGGIAAFTDEERNAAVNK